MFGPWQLSALFATGVVAGFVDSIAGGGGLLTLPVLLSLGLDPKKALGTNKLQATCGSGSAAWHYGRAGTVAWRDCIRAFTFTLIGAGIGAWGVRQMDPSFLKRALPVLLLGVAVYVLLKPDLGKVDLHPRLPRRTFDAVFGLALGFYDGFFGPGTGMFWTMAFVLGCGFNLTKATGYTKVVNFASNLGSLTFFIFGDIYLGAGLAMGFGQILGAKLGSGIVIKRGTQFIRPIFISVVLALTLKLAWDNFRK